MAFRSVACKFKKLAIEHGGLKDHPDRGVARRFAGKIGLMWQPIQVLHIPVSTLCSNPSVPIISAMTGIESESALIARNEVDPSIKSRQSLMIAELELLRLRNPPGLSQ